MPSQNQNTEIRSEEVQEIMSRVPHWLIRWGSAILFFIFFLFFAVAWFVKYPDIIKVDLTITTQIPPEKLIAKSTGKLQALLVENNAIIVASTPIAVIENTANFKDVFLLKSILDTISISKTKFPFHLFQNSQLGDVENSFAAFQREFLANELNNKLKPYQIESNAQRLESNHLKERLSLLESQKNITESELEIQKSDLERYEKLYKKDIIAAQELEKHRLQYLQAQKGFKALLSTISQLKSSLNELKRNSQSTQINEEKDIINLDRSLTQAFFALKKSLSDWELTYVLKSSISGKVSYLQLWSENQPVNTGDVVFSVIPSLKSTYIAKAKAPAANAGKLAAKQLVNIRLLNYPDREFGVIKGFVQNIAATPDKDGNLLIDITLPQGLKTSYEKDIAFQQEMSGTGDIITKDLRLLERFLYQFRDMVRR